MKTLVTFAFITLSSVAQAQQPKDWTEESWSPARTWPVEPEVPPRKWKDYNINIEGMARTFAPMAYEPQSYQQYMNSGMQPKSYPQMHPNMPQMGHIRPNNSQPVKIRDSQGRITGTLFVRPNGEVTVRDNRGRVSTTATVRAGTINQRSTKGASKPKSK